MGAPAAARSVPAFAGVLCRSGGTRGDPGALRTGGPGCVRRADRAPGRAGGAGAGGRAGRRRAEPHTAPRADHRAGHHRHARARPPRRLGLPLHAWAADRPFADPVDDRAAARRGRHRHRRQEQPRAGVQPRGHRRCRPLPQHAQGPARRGLRLPRARPRPRRGRAGARHRARRLARLQPHRPRALAVRRRRRRQRGRGCARSGRCGAARGSRQRAAERDPCGAAAPCERYGDRRRAAHPFARSGRRAGRARGRARRRGEGLARCRHAAEHGRHRDARVTRPAQEGRRSRPPARRSRGPLVRVHRGRGIHPGPEPERPGVIMALGRLGAGGVLALLLYAPTALFAQRDSAEVVPGPRYGADRVQEFFLGANWRELWLTPIRAPVLDLGSFAGGLEPFRTGGNQSTTLHMYGADGRRYIFRSVDKFVQKALPPDLRGTPVGTLIQGQSCSLFRTAVVSVGPIQDAVGVLYPPARLYVMPDDPRLGEFREDFAGMLGVLFERPNEGPDETPGFAGSRRIVEMERMLERLIEDPEDRVDSREYLAARLIDFLINDTDRSEDQWRWARLERDGAYYRWRPIALDRDGMLMNSDGVLGAVARSFYPKLVAFGPRYPGRRSL